MLKAKAILIVGMTVACGAMSTRAQAQWTDLGRTPSGGTFVGYFRPAATHHTETAGDMVDVYAVESGSSQVLMREINATTGALGSWTALGGVVDSIMGIPTTVSWPGRREVFVIGTDHKLYRNFSVNNGAFSGWQFIGPPTSSNVTLCSPPSAVTWGPGRIDVFAEGCADGHLWHVTGLGNGWNWVDRGCCTDATPVATSYAGARLDIWVSQSSDLYDFQYNGSSWTKVTGGLWGEWPIFAATPNPATGSPITAVGFMQNAYPSNQFLEVVDDAGTWTGGTGIYTGSTKADVPPYAKPGVANEDGFADIYYRNSSNQVERLTYSWIADPVLYSWGTWTIPSQTLRTADTFVSDPTPVALNGSLQNRPIMVFAVNSAGHMLKGNDSAH